MFNLIGDYLEKESVCLDSMYCWARWLLLWWLWRNWVFSLFLIMLDISI